MNLLYNNTTKLSSDDTLMDELLRAYLTVCRLLTALEIEKKCIFAVVMPNNIGPIVTGSVSFYKYVFVPSDCTLYIALPTFPFAMIHLAIRQSIICLCPKSIKNKFHSFMNSRKLRLP